MTDRRTTGAASAWRRLGRVVGLVAMIGVADPGTAPAQSLFNHNGFTSQHDSWTVLPYEHVDPVSGNLLIVATDLALPGNAGLDLRVVRAFNSSLHPRYAEGDYTLEERSWAGIGWRLHFGRVIRPDVAQSGATLIEMPDGSRQPLYTTTARPEGWTTKSFAVYDRTAHTLKLPNGLVYTFGHVAAPNGDLGAVRYVTEIRDPFNNRLTFTYFAAPGPTDGVASVRQWFGTQYREVTFTYDPATNALATMVYAGRTWRYTTQAADVPGHVWLRTVARPEDLPTWGYDYATPVPGRGGELSGVHVPGGGRVDYTYQDVTRVANGHSFVGRAVVTRATSGTGITPGTWTFQYATGTNHDTTIVTTPCGTHRSRFRGTGDTGTFAAWEAGLLAERTVEESGLVLEREQLTYLRSEAVSPDPVVGEPDGTFGDPAVYLALTTQRVVTRGPQSWTTAFDYHWGEGRVNDYGRPYQIRETGERTRRTVQVFTYAFTPYLLDRVGTVDVYVGTDPEPVWASRGYSAATGFVTSETAHGLTQTFEPTTEGNISAVVDPHGHRTTFTYAWGALKDVTTPTTTTTRVINPDGTVASETQVGTQGDASLTTSYGYDPQRRLRLITPPPPSRATSIYIDPLWDRAVTVTRGTSQVTTSLDGVGRPWLTVNSQGLSREVIYDACGRVTKQSSPYPAGALPGDIHYVETAYDALGRVRTVTDGPAVTQSTYTGIDVAVLDAEGRTTTYDASAFGDPGSAVLVGLTDARTKSWSYAYDRFGRLTQVTPPDGAPVRQWASNAQGLLASETQPEAGTTTYSYTNGLVTSQTNALGQTLTFGYDADDRLRTRTGPGTSATWTYDTLGRLTAAAVDGVTTASSFVDPAGRLVSRSDTLDGRTFTTTFEYTEEDHLKKITYPPVLPAPGRVVEYTYDGEFRLTGVTQNGAAFASTIQYDTRGRFWRYQTGAVLHTTEYDTRDRVEILKAAVGQTTPFDLRFQYSDTNQVELITDPRPNASQSFTPDTLDRLQSATGPWGTLTWTYDAQGNRVTQTLGGATTTYSYSPTTNRLSSTSGAMAETFQWNSLGQLTSDSRGTYAYTTLGQLATVTAGPLQASYAYDADTWRIKRTVDGVVTYTLRAPNGKPLREYESRCGTFRWIRDYVYAGDRLVGAIRVNDTPATIAFAATSSNVNENTGSANVLVRLVTASGQPLACAATVDYQITAGTATEGSDYTLPPLPRRLTFAAGSPSGTTQAIAVPLVNDAIDEAPETFTITLTSASGAGLGNPTAHVVTIDDDDPAPTLTINDVTVAESAGQAVFTVTLTGATAQTVQVNYATEQGTAFQGLGDLTLVSGTLTFPPVQPPPPSQTRTISVPILEDATTEPSETFWVNLSAPVNAQVGDAQGAGTITDNDGTYVPIDLALGGLFVADLHTGPSYDDYLLIANPHATAQTARLTYIRPNGSGATRDVAVPAGQRITILLGLDPVIGCQGLVSAAVQSLNSAYPLDVEHTQYNYPIWDAGRSTEGATPAPTWYLAEGSVGYFEEYLTVFNPTPWPLAVSYEFATPSGPVMSYLNIPSGPNRFRVRVRDWHGGLDHGTIIRATRWDTGAPAPIVVERTQTWEADVREAHSSPGVSALATTWSFAEGNRGYFDTYVALLNPQTTASTVEVKYLHENGTSYPLTVSVPARGRATVAVPTSIPTGSFGIVVTDLSGRGIAAERMMYGGTNWTIGHVGVGQPLGTTWRFVEGVTGSLFDTYVLLANPGTGAATATLTATRTDGGVVTYGVGVPARGRVTVYMDGLPGLESASFRLVVTSTQPIVVERASYWPQGGGASAATNPETPGLTSEAATATVVAEDGTQAFLPTLWRSPYDPTLGPIPRVPAYHFLARPDTGPPDDPSPGVTILDAPAAGTLGPAAPLALWTLPWYGGHLTGGRRP